MRKRLLLLAGLLLAAFVGWAVWHGMGLRSRFGFGSSDVGQRLELRIKAENPTPKPGETAQITVRLRNVSGEAFQAPSPGFTKHAGFAWHIVGPDGAAIPSPSASGAEDRYLAKRKSARYVSRAPAGTDTIHPQLDARLVLQDPMRGPETQAPGEYRITLTRTYSTETEAHKDYRPGGLIMERDPTPPKPDPDALPRAAGVVRSNTIVVTRVASK